MVKKEGHIPPGAYAIDIKQHTTRETQSSQHQHKKNTHTHTWRRFAHVSGMRKNIKLVSKTYNKVQT